MTASWRKILGWPYEVSSAGEVRNARTGRVLRPDVIDGYRRVTLSLNNRLWRVFVHQLVCAAFHGFCPEDATCVRHRDGDRSNNSAANVCWGTHAENEQDKRLHGTYQEREKNPFAKLTEAAVASIREAHIAHRQERAARGYSKAAHGFIIKLAADHGVSTACIKLILCGRNWPEAESCEVAA